MAACTHGVQTGSSVDGTTFATGAFTPVANDLLVCMVEATDTVDAGAVTSTGNTASWTKITSAAFGASAHTAYLFVQTALAAASSTVVTFACAGDASTGAVVAVVRVSGMTRTGASAVRQSGVVANLSSTTTVQSPTFGVACLTGNPTLEFAGNANGDTYQPPVNWTEGAPDTTLTVPASGFVYHTRDSGFTGTNIGWADTVGFSPTLLGIIAAELDTSAVATTLPPRVVVVDTAVARSTNY